MKLICQVCLLAVHVCLACNDKISAASDAKVFRISMSPEQPVLFSYVTSFLSFVWLLAFYFRPQGLLGRADGNRCISGRFYKYHLRVPETSVRNIIWSVNTRKSLIFNTVFSELRKSERMCLFLNCISRWRVLSTS